MLVSHTRSPGFNPPYLHYICDFTIQNICNNESNLSFKKIRNANKIIKNINPIILNTKVADIVLIQLEIVRMNGQVFLKHKIKMNVYVMIAKLQMCTQVSHEL